MSDDGAQRDKPWPPCAIGKLRCQPANQPSLAEVSRECQESCFFAGDSQDIGKPDIATARRARIHCSETLGDDDAERDRPKEITADDHGEWQRLSHGYE